MRRSKVFLLSILCLLLTLSYLSIHTYAKNKKPNFNHFTNYLYEEYGIQCNDAACTSFYYPVIENGEELSILMWLKQSETSSSTYSFSLEHHYFSEPGSSYYWRFKATGSFGEFTIVEDDTNLLTKK